jgi:UDP-2-acetamido-2,6-beta-L-arabino-hexul-4-ose reductase
VKSVLVTGAEGFIGKNLCVNLEQDESIEVLRYGRGNTADELGAYAQKADFVFHLAGVNRPQDEKEHDTGNRAFTQELLDAMVKGGNRPSLAITSSIQAEEENAYGRSKKAAEQLVFDWARSSGNAAYVYRLPNVFGKWANPNYNSVVATFCHNIANGMPIQINDPGRHLTLVYIDDVVAELIRAMDGAANIAPDGFCYMARDFHTTLQDLADTIRSFPPIRDELIVPDFEGDFERFLFATFTSYFNRDNFGYDLQMRHDERGWLAEFIKSNSFGQIFVSRTKPGITRGNHWHNTKVEKFLVLAGKAEIAFRKINSDQVIKYPVSGEQLKVVDIPAGYTHSITNTGDTDLVTLFWADEIFNPEKTDTYFLEVQG